MCEHSAPAFLLPFAAMRQLTGFGRTAHHARVHLTHRQPSKYTAVNPTPHLTLQHETSLYPPGLLAVVRTGLQAPILTVLTPQAIQRIMSTVRINETSAASPSSAGEPPIPACTCEG